MNLFIQHTSASLTCASVAAGDELETMLNDVVPERWNREFFKHTYEVRLGSEPCRAVSDGLLASSHAAPRGAVTVLGAESLKRTPAVGIGCLAGG